MRPKVVKSKAKSNRDFSYLLQVLSGILFVSLPFIVSFTGYDKFRVPKDIYLNLFVLVMGAVFLASRRWSLRLSFRSWELLLVAGIVYVGITSFLSPRPEVSIRAFFQITYFSVLLLILREIAWAGFQRKLWIWISAATGISALITVLEYFGKVPFILRPSGEVLEGRVTPAGLIGDVNSGGFLFGLVCLILLYGILGQSDRKIQFISLALFLVNLTGMAFTRTLTAIFSLLACLAVWLVFHHWWVFRTERRLTRAVVILWIVLALGFVGAGVLGVKAGVMDRVELVWEQMRRGDWSAATSGRQPVYLITWEMIKEQPWLGYGLNTFGQDFFFYRSQTAFGQEQELLNLPGAYREVHNEYLQIWEELGLSGLLFFLVLLVGPVLLALPLMLRLKDPQEIYWLGVLCLGVLYTALNSLGFFPFHVSLTAAYIVLLIGGLRHFETRHPPPATRHPSPATRHPSSDYQILKIAALSCALLALGFFQVQKWRANHELGVGAFLLESTVSGQYDARQRRIIAGEALRRLEHAEDLYPYFYDVHNLAGSAKVLMGRPAEAVKDLRKASVYLPSPEVFTNLGAAYLADRRFDKARASIELALRYNPDSFKARQALNYLETNGL
ncbi:MAG: O-antigen ligase family protein [Acidobacteriota bacterium]